MSPREGILDGAACFVSVRAVGEPAVGKERPELDEMTRELARNGSPQLKLAETRRVNDVATGLEARLARPSWWCAFP